MKKSILFIVLAIWNFQVEAADYRFNELISYTVQWTVDAAGYSEYRWKRAAKQFKNSTIGSSVRFEAAVDARDIETTVLGEPGLSTFFKAADARNRDDLGEQIISVTTEVTAGSDGAGDAQKWGISDLMQSQIVSRSTESYQNSKSYPKLVVTLLDSSDRMAMELEGIASLTGQGRIKSLEIDDAVISVTIDVMTWQPTM